MDRHFTSTVFVVDLSKEAILLHWHEKVCAWLPPGGHIERDEDPVQAAKREVLEETNINIEIDKLLGVYSSTNNDTIFIAYSARAINENIVIGSESVDVSWFEVNHLPSLAFKHDQKILQRWKDLYYKSS